MLIFVSKLLQTLADVKEAIFLLFYTKVNGANALEYNNDVEVKGALLDKDDPRPV